MNTIIARTLIAFTLMLIFISEASSAGVNAFLYHRFDESRYASTNISSEVFAQQLAYLQENNYRVLSLQEVVRRLRNGESLPEKSAVLSVDDSFVSFKEKAMPLLRQYQYPVTLFVNTDSVGTSGYLDWKELQELVLEGVEIGNHSAAHDYLVDSPAGETREEWRKRVWEDLEKAQLQFDKYLRLSPTLFAYPYGEYNLELLELVEDFGFEAAFAQQSGVIHEKSKMMNLPRFPMGGPFATLKGFKNKVRMKPLVVTEEDPAEPVMSGNNPPILQLRIDSADADVRRMNCFVQGDNSCTVRPVEGEPGQFVVQAEKPLSGRRNKYTLTAPGAKGGWHWYSHLWVKSANGISGMEKRESAFSQADSSVTIQPVVLDQ